jgi:SAM-dependent methyltransferase
VWCKAKGGVFFYGMCTYVKSQEKRVLDRLLKNKRGNDLLQIGGPSDGSLVEKAQVMRQFFVDTHFHVQCSMPFIQADAECLPIQTESIDIVLLVHELESARNAMDVLREVHRVLRPNGQIIIVGFNKWGLWNLLHAREKKQKKQKKQKNFSIRKIKQYLCALDFDVTKQQTLCFWPPSILAETLGQFFLPFAGSVYLLVAKKNIPGVTPLVVNNYVRSIDCNAIKFQER